MVAFGSFKATVTTAIATEVPAGVLIWYVNDDGNLTATWEGQDLTLPEQAQIITLDSDTHNNTHVQYTTFQSGGVTYVKYIFSYKTINLHVWGLADNVFGVGAIGFTVVVGQEQQYMGQLRGLCGLFDDDQSNDFTSQNGIEVDISSPAITVHFVFGESWRVTEADSVFDYARDGTTYQGNNDLSYQPTFTTPDFSQSGVSEAVADMACADAKDLFDACKFDVAVSGTTEAATSALTATTVENTVTPPTQVTSSGGQDPHFHGFHGESLDLVHDDKLSGSYVALFCHRRYSVFAELSATPDELLFMTRVVIVVNHLVATVAVEDLFPSFSPFTPNSIRIDELNRERFMLSESSHIEYNPDHKRVNAEMYDGLRVVILLADEDRFPYLDVSFIGPQTRASGLLGQTMKRKVPQTQFEDFKRFVMADYLTYDCPLN
eukprot:NODE_472_length_1461_cov_97.821589_g439_i0.p1 GENE.NODE_472_length_1461_cov_97.821589_g439_i0~~NODE_472_length_1461_cov_97.821589_g439_i0.p1  ORF type:complete len:463 (+),score=81.96 NODE_472_length_1461_cov_97.821589_g439_i0:88-1389(+)